VNLKEKEAGSAGKPRSSAGEGGKLNRLEAGVWLETAGNTWDLLDSPPEEDSVPETVHVSAADEDSGLEKTPTKADEAGLAPSLAPNTVTSKPSGGSRFRTNPEDTSVVVSGEDGSGQEA